MHPEMLRALAQAKHMDLLDSRRPRRQRRSQLPRYSRLHVVRRRLGTLLIWTGARLIADQQAAPELAPE